MRSFHHGGGFRKEDESLLRHRARALEMHRKEASWSPPPPLSVWEAWGKVPPSCGLEAACVFRHGQQRAPGPLHSRGSGFRAWGPGLRAQKSPTGTHPDPGALVGHRWESYTLLHTHSCQVEGGAQRAPQPGTSAPGVNQRDFSQDEPAPDCDIKWVRSLGVYIWKRQLSIYHHFGSFPSPHGQPVE